MEQDFSFKGICRLCREHFEEILDLYDCDMNSTEYDDGMKRLNGLLENRKIRFINPWGRFEYTKFGRFYFDENNVMMLITIEREYALYHRPDILSYTLWSTVPVIFAGIDTRVNDDCGQPIFTGDVVTADGMETSLVRYFHPTIPGLAGDNCESQFHPGLTLHKEGTVFRDISLDQFKHFDPFFFHWPLNQFVPNGMWRDEVRKKAQEVRDRPTFAEPIKPLKGYKTIYCHYDEVLRDSCVLVYFTCPMHFDDDNDDGTQILCDNYPEIFKGETYEIEIRDKESFWGDMIIGIDSFLHHAHQHPETRFVLGDFVEMLNISKNQQFKTAMLFHDWDTYNLTNVILPAWILFRIASYEGIGRD